jgi:hypothetical protein
MPQESGKDEAARPGWGRYLPLAVLALALALAFAFDLHLLVSFEALEEHHGMLREAVDARPVLTALGYVLGYATAVAVCRCRGPSS